MKKLKPFLPSMIAVAAAIAVSICLIENTLVILSCFVVGFLGLAFTAVRSIQLKHSS